MRQIFFFSLSSEVESILSSKYSDLPSALLESPIEKDVESDSSTEQVEEDRNSVVAIFENSRPALSSCDNPSMHSGIEDAGTVLSRSEFKELFTPVTAPNTSFALLDSGFGSGTDSSKMDIPKANSEGPVLSLPKILENIDSTGLFCF